MPKKTYLLDTNVLLNSPYAIYAFDEHNVSIADVTLEELDRHKSDLGEVGANAREAIRILEELRMQGSLLSGVSMPMGGGDFKIEVNHLSTMIPEAWDKNSPDNRILRVCKGICEENKEVILVSNDINMRIKADLLNIPAETYRTEQVKHTEDQYRGRASLLVNPGCIAKFYATGELAVEDIYIDETFEDEILEINEFLSLSDAADPSQSALAKFNGKKIVALEYLTETPYGVITRNSGQRFLQEALLAPVEEIPLVIIKGSAGSSKTFYSLACGLQKVIEEKAYRKILLTRPNVKFDDDIGFLKGTEEEKIAPLIRPFMDNLELLTRTDDNGTYADELFDRGYIEAQAMAYMRGRSITDTWIILDEFQNATPLQAFGMISRAGVRSKVIIMGDPDQIDHPRLDSRTNGLVYASERMKGSPLCAQITMTENECVRSPLAIEAIKRMSPKGYR